MQARIRGTEIYYDIDGAGSVPDGDRLADRPVVFLLHGGPGGDHVSWKAEASALRDVAQLVYFDNRGSGRSADADPLTYTMDENVADLDALREQLGLERITVFGGSYGGMVAQAYSLAHPERVANLILLCTAPSHRFIDDARRNLAERGTPDQLRVCERLWAGAFTSTEELREYYEVMGPLYSVKPFEPDKFATSWARSRRNFEAINRGFAGFMRTFDFTPRLGEIRCPTLVLAGAHDWICPPEHSRIIAELIPRAHLKVFAHSGHGLASDETDAFLAAVRGFLTYAAA